MTDRAELMDDLRQFFTYTDEEQQDIVDKAIAALEAKPEPKCKTCDDTRTISKGNIAVACRCPPMFYGCPPCKGQGIYEQTEIADCPDCKEPAKPLPESDQLDWLVHDWLKSAVGKPLIRDEAVHWFRKVFDKIDELHSQHQAELAAAKEQGRREALQEVPLEALAFADDTMESEWIDTIEDAAADRITAHRDAIKKLIKSARDAQEEV